MDRLTSPTRTRRSIPLAGIEWRHHSVASGDMTDPHPEPKPVFATPWFQILEQQTPGKGDPHYVIRSPDFVVIVALDAQARLLLVRQFRPAVAAVTLELPAGHVEPGQTPEQGARKELPAETGHAAGRLEPLGTFRPSPAPPPHRRWRFFP